MKGPFSQSAVSPPSNHLFDHSSCFCGITGFLKAAKQTTLFGITYVPPPPPSNLRHETQTCQNDTASTPKVMIRNAKRSALPLTRNTSRNETQYKKGRARRQD